MGAEHPSRGTVLLVEDEESIADLVRLYLERDGFRVVWRTDGPSGLAAVDAERPRLVLLDLMLPGINGVQVCRDGAIGDPRELVDLSEHDVHVEVDLRNGRHSATIWTNDLTYDYVKENAEYPT